MNEDEFFRDWNIFSGLIMGLDQGFYNTLVDYGTDLNINVHKNVPSFARNLGDVEMANLFYTPQEIYPCIIDHDKVVISDPEGVWIGKDRKVAEALLALDCDYKKISPENVLITSEIIDKKKNPEFLWKYLTGEGLSKNSLKSPLKGSDFELKKSDYVGAAYFLWGKEDLRDPKVYEELKSKEELKPKNLTDKIRRMLGHEKNLMQTGVMDWLISAVHHGIEGNSENTTRKKTIRMITDLDELLEPEYSLPIFYALQNGYDVQIIIGPEFYCRPENYKKIYPDAIELSDGFSLEFTPEDSAVISNLKNRKSNENAKSVIDSETAKILTALAEKNKKPILHSIAANACVETMRKEGECYEMMSMLAYNLYKSSSIYSSVSAAEKALSLAGPEEKAEASSSLGFLYSKAGLYDKSIDVLKMGMDVDGTQKYIHNNLATTHHILAAKYEKKIDFEEAETHYLKELENTPDHPYAETMLSHVKRLKGLMELH